MSSEVQFYNAISNLQPIAGRYGRFQEHPEEFLKYVNHELSREALELHANKSTEQLTEKTNGLSQIRPVTFLRHVIARRILNGQSVSAEDIEEIQEHIDARDPAYFSDFPDLREAIAHQKARKRSAFGSWTLFTLLHGLDYRLQAEQCKNWITDVADFLQDRLDLSGCDYHAAGFGWNQNFGTTSAWVALYPATIGSHQEAYEVHFSVKPDGLSYGLHPGGHLDDDASKDMYEIAAGSEINVEAMMETCRELLPRFHELNRQLLANRAHQEGDHFATGKQRAWVIASGRGAGRWEEFSVEGLISIGWDGLGPLQQYTSKGDIHDASKQSDFSSIDALGCYEFAHKMKEGDLVFAKTGRTEIVGAGIIESPYRFDEQREHYKHVRDVRWLETGQWETLPHAHPRSSWDRAKKESDEWRGEPRKLPRKTLTELTPSRGLTELEILVGIDGAAEAGYRDPLPIDEELLGAAVRDVIRPELEAGTFDGGSEAYIQNEVLPKAQRHLLAEALEEDPISHASKAIEMSQNLLGWREQGKAKKRIASADPAAVREQLTTLFRGNGSLEERLDSFLTWGHAGDEGSINGTTASFLLAAYNPARYVFCKPTVYKAAAQALLGPQAVCPPSEEAARVAHAARLYGDVLRQLRRRWDLPFRNLMHVHTAFYLVSSSDAHPSWDDLRSMGNEREKDDRENRAEEPGGDLSSANGSSAHGSPANDTPPTYTSRDGAEGLFHDHATFKEWLGSLKTRKNIILQGPPGVGKTFVARRLAYALMGQKDTRRTEMVQFHQSYAYEDFIQGYRPGSGEGFELQNGAFYRFARQAQQIGDRPHVFLIDEINRGNLSKIFGELMMLIEPDKRGPNHAMSLTYQEEHHDDFYVPENLYLIGMMNTADRSLAMVDYALRRRFRFIDMEPQFGALFQKHLGTHGASGKLIRDITRRIKALNKTIASDSTLGPGFQIGHSYFCPREDETPDRSWYEQIVQHEIGPLLREYWFDAPEKAKTEVQRLVA